MAPPTTPSPGFSLEVTITIDPSNIPKFLSLFHPIYELVTAEPECTFFEVFIDPEKPGVIHWVEGWKRDKQWFFDVQFKKEYYKDYLEKTVPMFVAEREFKFFERLPVEWTYVKPEHSQKV
ncbi:Dimeric alpha+beta barrel [Glarea lozoyensis ATCC 20868]|uniref:Dimeric alpha+beta barrel n=2 Tax=Glarea lozoyensis TaxID=101852 RepID=S3DAK9_GLAL2|nr:Dimeric alpha+beta barrel [Glarea lozoyensis ATCC 20868]EHL00107.1 hypothetical protein M7I_3984 [Glarea lozoyensis 74030]EPE34740.1 Dimeric alpha+beta barrel [Glarea lozoyensis ATCC 20868]